MFFLLLPFLVRGRIRLRFISQYTTRYVVVTCLACTGLLDTSSAQESKNLVTSNNPPRTLHVVFSNDLHSHFLPRKSFGGLGGYARIKTLLTSLRTQFDSNPDNLKTITLDVGDFSEGNSFFLADEGQTSFDMLSKLGFDYGLLGNHEYLFGPELLLKWLKQSTVSSGHPTKFLSANLNSEDKKLLTEYRKVVQSLVIHKAGPYNIALIGLANDEDIYTQFLKPITIDNATETVKKLVKRLKSNAQLNLSGIIVYSHNDLKVSEKLAKAVPDVDLVIAAHDHILLTEPIEIKRHDKRSSWVVEAGYWGQWLGDVTLQVREKSLIPIQYTLHTVNESIPEDPEVKALVESAYQDSNRTLDFPEGRIFKEKEFNANGSHSVQSPIAHLNQTLGSMGYDPELTSFFANKYRDVTGADVAIEGTAFTPTELVKGEVTARDVFDSVPSIFDFKTKRAWNLEVATLKGLTLKRFLDFYYASTIAPKGGILGAAGLQIRYNPLFRPEMDTDPNYLFPRLRLGSIHESIRQADGKPIENSKMYTMAFSGGLRDTIDYISSKAGLFFPIEKIEDTGLETWRAVANAIEGQNIDAYSYLPGTVSVSKPYDLSIHRLETFLERNLSASKPTNTINLIVRNLGETKSPEFTVHFELIMDQMGKSPRIVNDPLTHSTQSQDFITTLCTKKVKGLNPLEKKQVTCTVNSNIFSLEKGCSYRVWATTSKKELRSDNNSVIQTLSE